MTTVLESIDHEPPTITEPRRGLEAVREFDLLDTVGVGLARLAGVPPAAAPDAAPRLDFDLVKRVGGAIRRSPRLRPLLVVFAIALAAFTVAVLVLLFVGRLDDVYAAIWTWYPGRPWTHVMRDLPWVYLALSVPTGAVPFVLAPPQRWGRAFLTYVIFLIGFLGGHVYW